MGLLGALQNIISGIGNAISGGGGRVTNNNNASESASIFSGSANTPSVTNSKDDSFIRELLSSGGSNEKEVKETENKDPINFGISTPVNKEFKWAKTVEIKDPQTGEVEKQYYDENGDIQYSAKLDAQGRVIEQSSYEKGGSVKVTAELGMMEDEDGEYWGVQHYEVYDLKPNGDWSSMTGVSSKEVIDNLYERNLFDYTQFTAVDAVCLARLGENSWAEVQSMLEENPNVSYREIEDHLRLFSLIHQKPDSIPEGKLDSLPQPSDVPEDKPDIIPVPTEAPSDIPTLEFPTIPPKEVIPSLTPDILEGLKPKEGRQLPPDVVERIKEAIENGELKKLDGINGIIKGNLPYLLDGNDEVTIIKGPYVIDGDNNVQIRYLKNDEL